MNWNQDLEVIFGNTNQRPDVINGLTEAIRKEAIKGTFYIGYPVLATSESSMSIDALLVSQQPGLIAFHFPEPGEDYRESQDRLFYCLESNLKRHDSLRVGRNLGVPINIISLFPDASIPANATPDYLATTLTKVSTHFPQMKGIQDAHLYRKLSAAIQRVTTIKPIKKRVNVSSPISKGATLKKIEKQIANLDGWQKAAAIETPEGPQRIRGLAGSGKTVVLALKAAYLHTQHPTWKIAVTFHTRSLYQQFMDLIERFTLEHLGDKPNWQQLHIIHSWGSSGQNGVYSIACNAINLIPSAFLSAKMRYGSKHAFEGVCAELATAIKGKQLDLYDAVLIDEAQDLPPAFFQIVDAICKNPKRIIWAYDELQNLSETGMATTPELFGREVHLHNAKDAPRQDIILPVCYRNTPWALTLAHALGLGLFRDAGFVQQLDEPRLWEEIGYEVQNGTLIEGDNVTLTRAPKSFPNFFKQYLLPQDAVTSKIFDTRDNQYVWIADEVYNNIKVDELDPDDILIILPYPISQQQEYTALRRHLESRGIRSNLAGITNDRDSFIQAGSVTVSGIYRAKGNEAPMVYVANCDYCAVGHEMIRLRNILFTCITRSRAWVRLCGTAPSMNELQKEIDKVIGNDYKLSFRIPTGGELANARRLHRDRTVQEKGQIKKAEKNIEDVIGLLRDGVISPDAMPQLQELLRELEDRKKKGLQ